MLESLREFVDICYEKGFLLIEECRKAITTLAGDSMPSSSETGDTVLKVSAPIVSLTGALQLIKIPPSASANLEAGLPLGRVKEVDAGGNGGKAEKRTTHKTVLESLHEPKLGELRL